ncbi:hypothetical protein FBUS_00283 [Fasciolopsis buskii]|uniref:Uncharacterized protein n=1 Tax=Fasciolopsis buskii TaxID=27845 RepID=A0A8E0RNG7_9TREM|nr:hypothetical protein FBUS_00283 [Fasciolopsis buski]
MKNERVNKTPYPGICTYSRPPGFFGLEEDEEQTGPTPSSNPVTITCMVNSGKQNRKSIGHSSRIYCSSEILITNTNSPFGQRKEVGKSHNLPHGHNHDPGPEFTKQSVTNKLFISKMIFDLNRPLDVNLHQIQSCLCSRPPLCSSVRPMRVHFNQSPEINHRSLQYPKSPIRITKAPQRFQTPVIIQMENQKEVP